MTINLLQVTPRLIRYTGLTSNDCVIPTCGRNLGARLLLSKKISPAGRNDSSLKTLKQLGMTYSKV